MSKNNHYIVAIGASAGGLEAIHEFFDNMPSGGSLSFIIIQHLSPDYKSLLVKLISLHTPMQVVEADNNMEVEAGCIYVIPNNKMLTIREGKLELQDKKFEKAPNTAVDIFLNSLAADRGHNAIAIILSGTGTDGSKGIQEIKKNGGFVIVQDPITAKFDGMPNSAIQTGATDLILAPELMPDEIFTYIKKKPERKAGAGKPDESSLPEIFNLIDKHCQYDFRNYKSSTILRRISRRMGLLGYQKFDDYLEILRTSPDECKFLGKEFLIGVTKFFRDSQAFELLYQHVIIPLVSEKSEDDVLKVWVVACSTGQEAYSIAILIDRAIQQLNRRPEVKIFASDMDPEAIEVASAGTYSPENLSEISPDQVRKYFIKDGKKYTIIPRIRKQIVFARHNVLKDPPFIKNDLVTCRNMLIYMDNVLQKKIVSTFAFSINPAGFLFLGPSESPSNLLSNFQEINGKWKIYRKTGQEGRFNQEMIPSTALTGAAKGRKTVKAKAEIPVQDLMKEMYETLTEKYRYAAVYIDQNFEIREAVGDFRKYLSLPDRITNLNIMRMVGKELAIPLNAAVRKSKKENTSVSLSNVRVEGKEKNLNIYIRPSERNDYTLVILSESREQVERNEMPVQITDQVSVNYIHDLEEELKETRNNLQMAVENLETANEELQSSNEELISANEELQSSNEELQSLNEELHTLNTEHQLRIKELVELNDDLNNYFASANVAQVFIDSELRIRKFNPGAVQLINLIPSDIGRPISHISTNLRENKTFINDINEVLKSNKTVEREVTLFNGSNHLMRITPYIKQGGNIGGVVITFVDITQVKELNSMIGGVFNATRSAIVALKAIRENNGRLVDLEIITANTSFYEISSKKGKLAGHSIRKSLPSLFNAEFLTRMENVIFSGNPYHLESELKISGEKIWFDVTVTKMTDGVVVNLTNIQEKKLAEQKLRKNYQDLIVSQEEVKQLNDQLERKVSERTRELSESEERFRLVTTAISDAIYDRDLVNDHIWWSDSFYNWFGYDNSDKSNNTRFWKDRIHKDDRNRVEKEMDDHINNGTEWEIEYRLLKNDGEYVSVLDRGMAIKNEHGIPYRLLGALTDNSVAEFEKQNIILKETNLQLEELVMQRTANLEAQKTILQNLFMQAPAMICTLKGPGHRFDLVNPVYQRIFGNRKLTGLPILEALPELKGQHILKILDRVYQTGKTYIGREERIMVSPDEGKEVEELYFNFIYQPTYNESNEIDGILVFAYEVSDQVRAREAIQQKNQELTKLNEEFKFVTDFMPQMVWVTDPEGNHIFYNAGWYEYTGTTFEQTKNEGWNNVLHPEDQERAWEIWRHSIKTGEPYEIEYRFRRYDGEYRWFLGRALPMLDEEGRIVKWFGTCTDIHDNRMMNDILEQKVEERTLELKKTNHELEITNNELFQFASIASHDLKEPLRKILMFSSLFYERHFQELSGDAREILDKITSSARRMHALVEDLLIFTRLSVTATFERCNLNVIVNEVLSDLELTIEEKKASFTIDELPSAEVVPGQMRQVFQNIISNALKFSGQEKAPHISIRCTRVSELIFNDAYDPKGSFIRISISDNGIGFENDYAEKIFTIFQRLHPRIKYEGTGIGLAIARKIIHQHNGIIRATGKLHQGAEFSFVIPLKQDKERVEVAVRL